MAVCILPMPYEVEARYGVMRSPLLLVQRRWAITLYIGITAACQWLEVRIFLARSTPDLVFTCVLVVVAALAYEGVAPLPPWLRPRRTLTTADVSAALPAGKV